MRTSSLVSVTQIMTAMTSKQKNLKMKKNLENIRKM